MGVSGWIGGGEVNMNIQYCIVYYCIRKITVHLTNNC